MSKDNFNPKINVYTGLFTLAPTKAQRRMVQIIEAAIKNYCTIGVENTTYDSIAKTCKTSRSLIQHYFKDKDEIFEMVVKYIRVHYQQYAINAFQKKEQPMDRLVAYAEAALAWVEEYPKYQRVWNLFFYYCGINPRWRALETELVTLGHERITALLQDGANQGIFAPDNLKRRAKQIQVLLTGAIVTASTETLYVDFDQFLNEIVEGCVRLATAA
jgi:AcrR family transcriptional regulator